MSNTIKNKNKHIKNKLMISAAHLLLPVMLAIAAQPAHADSEKKWRPHIQLNAKVGNKRSIGRIGTFAPLVQSNDSMLFLDLRFMADSTKSQEGNFGLGYRWLDTARNAIWGAYAYYDRRHTALDSKMNQATFGFERLSETWDLRVNFYLPENTVYTHPDKEDKSKRQDNRFANTQIITGVQPKEIALKGLDMEVGRSIPGVPNLRIFAGGYFYSGREGAQSVKGVQSRLTYELNDYISFQAEVNHDNVRKTNAYAGIEIRIPLGEATSTMRNLTALERRMTEAPVRDVDIISGTAEQQYIVEKKEGLHYIHTDNATPPKDPNAKVGTFENPYHTNTNEYEMFVVDVANNKNKYNQIITLDNSRAIVKAQSAEAFKKEILQRADAIFKYATQSTHSIPQSTESISRPKAAGTEIGTQTEQQELTTADTGTDAETKPETANKGTDAETAEGTEAGTQTEQQASATADAGTPHETTPPSQAEATTQLSQDTGNEQLIARKNELESQINELNKDIENLKRKKNAVVVSNMLTSSEVHNKLIAEKEKEIAALKRELVGVRAQSAEAIDAAVRREQQQSKEAKETSESIKSLWNAKFIFAEAAAQSKEKELTARINEMSEQNQILSEQNQMQLNDTESKLAEKETARTEELKAEQLAKKQAKEALNSKERELVLLEKLRSALSEESAKLNVQTKLQAAEIRGLHDTLKQQELLASQKQEEQKDILRKAQEHHETEIHGEMLSKEEKISEIMGVVNILNSDLETEKMRAKQLEERCESLTKALRVYCTDQYTIDYILGNTQQHISSENTVKNQTDPASTHDTTQNSSIADSFLKELPAMLRSVEGDDCFGDQESKNNSTGEASSIYEEFTNDFRKGFEKIMENTPVKPVIKAKDSPICFKKENAPYSLREEDAPSNIEQIVEEIVLANSPEKMKQMYNVHGITNSTTGQTSNRVPCCISSPFSETQGRSVIQNENQNPNAMTPASRPGTRTRIGTGNKIETGLSKGKRQKFASPTVGKKINKSNTPNSVDKHMRGLGIPRIMPKKGHMVFKSNFLAEQPSMYTERLNPNTDFLKSPE